MFQEEKLSNDSFLKYPNVQHFHNPSSQFFYKVGNFMFSSANIIGKGNFSKVYRGAHQFNQKHKVAIKVIQKKSLNQDLEILVDSQLKILRMVNHQNIIKCYEIKEDEKNIYVIMELCEGGDLQSRVDKIGPMSEDHATPIIKGVLKGLLYLSQCNIIHRDIKAANIFIHNGVPKIADFGFAIRSTVIKQFQDIKIGSPIYMSPEGIKHNVYGPTTDVWSFGVFVYELLHGKTPYWHCTKQKQLKYNITNQIRWNHLKPNLSYSIKEVIFKCLEINYEKRITFEKLKQFDFFKQHKGYLKKENNQNKLSMRSESLGKGLKRIIDKERSTINKGQRRKVDNERIKNQNLRFQIMANERKKQQKCITEMKSPINKPKLHSATKYSTAIPLEKSKNLHSLIQNSPRSKRVMSQYFAIQNHCNSDDADSSNRNLENPITNYQQYQTNRSNFTFLLPSDRNQKSIDNQIGHRKLIDFSTNRTNKQKTLKVINFPSSNVNCYLYLIHFSRLIYKLVCHLRHQPNLESITFSVQRFGVLLLRLALSKLQDIPSNTYSDKNILFEYNNQNSQSFYRISQTIVKYIKQYEDQLHHFNHNSNPSSIVYENSILQKQMNRVLSQQIKTHKPNLQVTKLLYLSWAYNYHFNSIYLKYFLHLQSQQWYRCCLGSIIKQIETDIEFSNSVFNLQCYLKIKRTKTIKQ